MSQQTLSQGAPERPLLHKFVNVGDIITKEAGFMRGHGVRTEKENLVACVAGFVEKTNKLVFVRPMKSRYIPEVGHVVIGRIKEVGDEFWRVDIHAKTHSKLVLRFATPFFLLHNSKKSKERNAKSHLFSLFFLPPPFWPPQAPFCSVRVLLPLF